MSEANVLKCRRSNEIQIPISSKKQPNQQAGSNSYGPGLGSMQGIQVPGLSGHGGQMDKLLHRKEIDGFR
jgi:hypothetical protein